MIHGHDYCEWSELCLSYDIWRSCSGPSILQPSIFKPTLDYKTAWFGPKGLKGQFSVLNYIYFKTTCNISPHFLGPLGGLKIEGLLYTFCTWWIFMAYGVQCSENENNMPWSIHYWFMCISYAVPNPSNHFQMFQLRWNTGCDESIHVRPYIYVVNFDDCNEQFTCTINAQSWPKIMRVVQHVQVIYLYLEAKLPWLPGCCPVTAAAFSLNTWR